MSSVVRVYSGGATVVRDVQESVGAININRTGLGAGTVSRTGADVAVRVNVGGSVVSANMARVRVNVLRAAVRGVENISVVNIVDGHELWHGLGSGSVKVSFFDTNGRDARNIDWEPISKVEAGEVVWGVKIYLPWADNELVDVWSGDVYLERRGG
jgi:hypothetical protein